VALLALSACRTAAPAIYAGAVAPSRGEFAICGDTRPWIFGEFWRAPQGFERREVFDRLTQERPDFVVNTGDLVAFGSDESEWETFDRETAALRAAGVGYLPVLGNHDLWRDESSALENWFARFPFLGGKRWYEVRYGYVELLLLDTNDTSLSPAQVAEQDAWYASRLAECDADASVRCVIVVGHSPAMTNCLMHGSSAFVRSHFVEPAAAHPKVRAFVSGHVHSYEHFEQNGIHFLVSGGGGAPLMDVAGPTGEFHDLYDGPRGHHFCRVIPRDDRVDVEMVRLADDRTWSVADRWSIDLH
jgi:3',5'-cyclic AMP phosphodiesterase CpdA